MKEIVICSAIRLPDGRIIRGHRHGDSIRTAEALVNWEYDNRIGPCWDDLQFDGDSQGFVTSANRYVNRLEGMRLQRAAGIESVAEGGYRGDTLFSEDLY